jgi:hypothetical protein
MEKKPEKRKRSTEEIMREARQEKIPCPQLDVFMAGLRKHRKTGPGEPAAEVQRELAIEVHTVKRSSNDPNDVIKDIESDPVAGPALKEFTARAKDYHQHVHDTEIANLNEEEARLFELWWSGGSIGDRAKWELLSQNHPKAYSAIMSATSRGCG